MVLVLTFNGECKRGRRILLTDIGKRVVAACGVGRRCEVSRTVLREIGVVGESELLLAKGVSTHRWRK